MSKSYSRLNTVAVTLETPICRYNQGLPDKVSMDDPAVNVMSDFRKVKVVTVAPSVRIDDALQKMIHAEVRLLIVTDGQDHVLGLITARDIMGEKPVNYISRERVSRNEILVSHIMTPREEIEALSLADVYSHRVGDIVATLRESQRQHALVLDDDAQSGKVIRGIFSITQIGRQLGVEIQATGLVQSFAEIEALLA